MQSTVDWTDQVSAKFLTESNSGEDATTAGASVLRISSAVSHVPYEAAVVAVAVGGMLMNFVVLLGFCVAGRSKMNVSSAYIANHTTLERQTFVFIAQMLVSLSLSGPDFCSRPQSCAARFTKYLTTFLRLSYDNAKVTIDLRRTSNLQNIIRRAHGFS